MEGFISSLWHLFDSVWCYISRWISSGSAQWVNITQKKQKTKYLITNTPKFVIKIFVMRFASNCVTPLTANTSASCAVLLGLPITSLYELHVSYVLGLHDRLHDGYIGGYIWRLNVLVLLHMSVTCIISHKFIYMTAIYMDGYKGWFKGG